MPRSQKRKFGVQHHASLVCLPICQSVAIPPDQHRLDASLSKFYVQGMLVRRSDFVDTVEDKLALPWAQLSCPLLGGSAVEVSSAEPFPNGRSAKEDAGVHTTSAMLCSKFPVPGTRQPTLLVASRVPISQGLCSRCNFQMPAVSPLIIPARSSSSWHVASSAVSDRNLAGPDLMRCGSN